MAVRRLSPFATFGIVSFAFAGCASPGETPVLPVAVVPREAGTANDAQAKDAEAADADIFDATADATLSADAGVDASDAQVAVAVDAATVDGATPDAGCPTASITLALAGSSYSVASWQGGVWQSAPGALGGGTGSSVSLPAAAYRGAQPLVVFAGGSGGTGATGALQFATRTGASWTALSTIAGTQPARDDLTLVEGGRLVYQGADYKYYSAGFDGASWTTETIGAGADQSFAPRAPAAVQSDGETRLVNVGDNGQVFTRARVDADAGTATWSAASGVPSSLNPAAAQKLRPTALARVAADSLLVLFSADAVNDPPLRFSLGAPGTWSTAADVYNMPSNIAFSPDRVAVQALPQGRAVVVFRGGNRNLYTTFYDPNAMPRFSAPTLLTGEASLDTSAPPSIARGVCGSDAVLAYVDVTRQSRARIVRLTGTTWSAPEDVPGATGLVFAAVATHQ